VKRPSCEAEVILRDMIDKATHPVPDDHPRADQWNSPLDEAGIWEEEFRCIFCGEEKIEYPFVEGVDERVPVALTTDRHDADCTWRRAVELMHD
jgi:hypothetical protein